MPLITEQQSANAFLARGLACGEDGEQDDEPRCQTCLIPTDPDELADIDGGLCVPCVVALYGDDVYGPEHGRDL